MKRKTISTISISKKNSKKQRKTRKRTDSLSTKILYTKPRNSITPIESKLSQSTLDKILRIQKQQTLLFGK